MDKYQGSFDWGSSKSLQGGDTRLRHSIFVLKYITGFEQNHCQLLFKMIFRTFLVFSFVNKEKKMKVMVKYLF